MKRLSIKSKNTSRIISYLLSLVLVANIFYLAENPVNAKMKDLITYPPITSPYYVNNDIRVDYSINSDGIEYPDDRKMDIVFVVAYNTSHVEDIWNRNWYVGSEAQKEYRNKAIDTFIAKNKDNPNIEVALVKSIAFAYKHEYSDYSFFKPFGNPKAVEEFRTAVNTNAMEDEVVKDGPYKKLIKDWKVRTLKNANIGDGLRIAYNELQKRKGNGREKHIIYIGDGYTEVYSKNKLKNYGYDRYWMHSLTYDEWEYANNHGDIIDNGAYDIYTEEEWRNYYQSRGRMYGDKCMAYSDHMSIYVEKIGLFGPKKELVTSIWQKAGLYEGEEVFHKDNYKYVNDYVLNLEPLYIPGSMRGSISTNNIYNASRYTQMWVGKIKSDPEITAHYFETNKSFDELNYAISFEDALPRNRSRDKYSLSKDMTDKFSFLDAAVGNIYDYKDDRYYYIDQFKANKSTIFRSQNKREIEKYVSELFALPEEDDFENAEESFEINITEPHGLSVSKLILEDGTEVPNTGAPDSKEKTFVLGNKNKFSVIYKPSRPDKYSVKAKLVCKKGKKQTEQPFTTEPILVKPMNEPTILISQMPSMINPKDGGMKLKIEDNGFSGVMFKKASTKLSLKDEHGSNVNFAQSFSDDFSVRIKLNPFDISRRNYIFDAGTFKIGFNKNGRVLVYTESSDGSHEYQFGNENYKLESNILNEILLTYTSEGNLLAYINGMRFKAKNISKPIFYNYANAQVGVDDGMLVELDVSDKAVHYANVDVFTSPETNTGIYKWTADDFEIYKDESNVLLMLDDNVEYDSEKEDVNILIFKGEQADSGYIKYSFGDVSTDSSGAMTYRESVSTSKYSAGRTMNSGKIKVNARKYLSPDLKSNDLHRHLNVILFTLDFDIL